MTEQLLYATKVSSSVEHVRRRCVPQTVRRGDRDARRARRAVHHRAEPAWSTRRPRRNAEGHDPFAVALAQRPGGPVPPVDVAGVQPGQPGHPAATKAEHLQEIEDLYRNGAITSAERQRARDAVLTED